MSKVCGIFQFRENKVRTVEIKASLQSLTKVKDKDFDIWTKENVGLGQANWQFETKFPTDKSLYPGLNIVADAVLTNRTELFEKFGVLLSEQKEFSDEQLILKSYQKWGEDCPKYLAGDFAFAIRDEQNKKLFCSRDHLGGSSLYYYKDGEKFVFASEPRGIFSFDNVEKKLNEEKLAIFLLSEPHTYLADQSWFKNITPFPAGTSLTISRNDVRERKFWKPELKKSLPYKRDEEIIEAFRELFFEVIADCLKGRSAASLLSGGLDSSSIVSVAAKILEKQNREINVFAGVLDDENDKDFSDERFFIDQFESFPNVRINYVSVPEAGPFSNLEELFENLDFPHVSSRHFLYQAFVKEAEKTGAEILFDGVYGELGATFHGTGGFAELFSKFRWLTLWRELNERKKLYNDSIKYNIRANVINPLLPQFLINLRHGKLKPEIPFTKYHPINKHFAQKLLEKDDFIQHLPNQRISPNMQTNQLNNLKYVQRKLADLPSSNIGNTPVELRYPLLDKRLIEFSLAVPLHLKIKDGYYRYLIRAALDGILPPKIQWRTDKTAFSPDYVRRYNAQIGGVRELLAEIKANDPIREVLDIEKIKQWAGLQIADTENYTTNEMIAREQVPQAIYLIYFLRNFAEFRL